MRINKKLIKRNPNKKIYYNNKNYGDSFSIVIPFSHNRESQIRDSFYYLNKCKDIEKCEIIIVLYENDYKEYDFSEFSNLNYKIIWSKRNNPENYYCSSHARNIGILNCNHDWFLMLDSDIIIPENTCVVLSNLMRSENETKVFGTVRQNIDYHNKKHIHEFKKLHIDDTFMGFFFFSNRKMTINKIGGYDESMKGWGREDTDLFSRYMATGFQIKNIREQLVAYHVPHDYSNDWKIYGSDEKNHGIQDENSRTRHWKMENIGTIIQ